MIAPFSRRPTQFNFTQINFGNLQWHGPENLLHRLSIDHRENGAQGLVTPHDLVGAPAEDFFVEGPGQPKAYRDVITRAARLQLLNEPQPFLSEGKGQVVSLSLESLPRFERRPDRFPLVTAGSKLQLQRQPHRRWLFEESPQGQFRAKRLPDPRDYLRGQQRVPAQLKKVLAGAPTLHLPHP